MIAGKQQAPFPGIELPSTTVKTELTPDLSLKKKNKQRNDSFLQMVPRVMHVAGGEKKEGEGFASREAAAWIFRREVLAEMAKKKKKNPRRRREQR